MFYKTLVLRKWYWAVLIEIQEQVHQLCPVNWESQKLTLQRSYEKKNIILYPYHFIETFFSEQAQFTYWAQWATS